MANHVVMMRLEPIVHLKLNLNFLMQHHLDSLNSVVVVEQLLRQRLLQQHDEMQNIVIQRIYKRKQINKKPEIFN